MFAFEIVEVFNVSENPNIQHTCVFAKVVPKRLRERINWAPCKQGGTVAEEKPPCGRNLKKIRSPEGHHLAVTS